MSLQAGWSNVRFNPNARGENIARGNHYFNSSTNLRFQQNRYGITHAINWDVKNQSLTQHRIVELLQRAVLRILGRVPVHRSHRLRPARRPAGLALSLLGHAGRHRQRVEHLRRDGRHRTRGKLSRDERDSSCRRGWNPPPSADARRLQAAPPDLQQADGVLPAVDAHAGGHPAHPAHFDADRHRRLPPAARRRQPASGCRSSTPCSRGPKGSRSRS